MSKKKSNYVYSVSYASGLFRPNNRDNTRIYSDVQLKDDEFIIVEHVNSGIFIAKVMGDITDNYDEYDDIDELKASYRFIQKVDLSKFLAEKERLAKKAELEEKMKSRFAIIDEKKKFEYYASIDDEMAQMYNEYKELGD